jgi:hypothetical protein
MRGFGPCGNGGIAPKSAEGCEWLSLTDALRPFALCEGGTQSAAHIRPLHCYVGCRLAVEGGFHPDEITPRPPLLVRHSAERPCLEWNPSSRGSGERVILGGLKTKKVDVVITKDGIGPVLAISVKGTLGAFRNLTNRMEEAVGDCTNLHLAYPALVYGFFHVLRANRQRRGLPPNDIALTAEGSVAESIRRYHDILARLADRADVRAESTKYEAIAMALVSAGPATAGQVVNVFPEMDSPLQFNYFFDKLYRQYDERFVYAAPALESKTRRLTWDPRSPIVKDLPVAGYEARLG